MISIIVPTLGRPGLLGAMINSVRTTTPIQGYELLFVVDPDDRDTHDALTAYPGLDVRICVSEGTYPEKTNAGFRESEGDLVLPTADDVRFHPWWHERVIQEFEDPEVAVVGTNDLSPATEDGSHATMPIVRHSYVEDPGAVLDEPGLVFWEGYHHNFCETELWQLAWFRRVARYRPDAVIEHLHPDWGKRIEDATDQKGGRNGFDADAEKFYERAAAWT